MRCFFATPLIPVIRRRRSRTPLSRPANGGRWGGERWGSRFAAAPRPLAAVGYARPSRVHPGGEEGGARRRGRSGGQREIQVTRGGEPLLEEYVCVVNQSDQSSRVILKSTNQRSRCGYLLFVGRISTVSLIGATIEPVLRFCRNGSAKDGGVGLDSFHAIVGACVRRVVGRGWG